jgi:glycine hydroxymethyltransferase
MNQVAGKVQGFYEALQPEFSQYTDDVVNTAKTMSDIFIENGLNVLTNGTDSHMVIVETGEKSGKEVADILEQEHNIIVNKNSIPNDSRGVWETSGIRLIAETITQTIKQ